MSRASSSCRVGTQRRRGGRPRGRGFWALKVVRAHLRRGDRRGGRHDTLNPLAACSICVFKGAQISRQRLSSDRAVRVGSIEAQQAKKKRRSSSKPTALSTHPSRRLTRVQSRVTSRHATGSSTPLAVRRILILHQPLGCRGLACSTMRIRGALQEPKMHAKREFYVPPTLFARISMCRRGIAF